MVIFLVVGKEIQQKNEWLIMIKLHQSKNILRVSNHKIIFSELVIFLYFRSLTYETVSIHSFCISLHQIF